MTINISVTGVSHHETPVELREFLAFAPDEVVPALQSMNLATEAAAILSTCNRTELYLAGDPATEGAASQMLAGARSGPTPEGVHFFHYSDEEAVRHLYRVAAGLDSLVIGESEILGQVREAFSSSTSAGTGNPVLGRLFHSALRVGRRARSETAIGTHGLSVSALAVSLSRKALGDLRHKTVLVVGAGEAGQRSASALAQNGVGRLLVTTRRSGLAAEIARQLDGVSLPFSEMPSALSEADVVITATSAPAAIISAEQIRTAMATRPERPLVIVDIAVPRDVDAAGREVEGVHLYDIDDLEAAAEANLDARKREVEAVEKIIAAEMARFQQWLATRGVEPTVAGLRQRSDQIRQAELDRTVKRLGHLSEADRQRLEAMSKALVNRLLHDPVQYLRESASDAELALVHNLFALEPVADPDPRDGETFDEE